ncbi:MAG TPA: YceI family protein [Vulgatibacter sp.]|nr:YceI family protein [Vulgatibacter sp.]
MWFATTMVAVALAAAAGAAPAAPAPAPKVAAGEAPATAGAPAPGPAGADAEAPPAVSGGAEAAKVEWSGRGRVEYQVSHKLHEVHGVTEEATARATATGDVLSVVARARVDSFDSKNRNRDRHAREAIEAERFPIVEVRGEARGFSPPVGSERRITLSAEVDFHGVVVRKEIPLVLKPRGPDGFEATFEFPVSLEAHRVERPSLFRVKVADEMRIRGTIALERIAAVAPSASQDP